MNVNRDNYEEFFLLYVDGELNIQQQEMVELFATANPDLQQELQLLLQTKLAIEDTFTFDKDALYKQINQGVNSTNYEEKFLLYVDQELDITTKTEVETFVLQHPETQTDFTLLKQTKLPVENIVCPDKESLYKKEEKPVIVMWAKRLAVAAAILFFAIMAWLLIPNTTTVINTPTAKSSTKEKNIIPSATPNIVNPLTTDNTNPQQHNNSTVAITGVETKNNAIKKEVIPFTKKQIKTTQQPSTKNALVIVEKQNNTINNTIIPNTQKQKIIITANNTIKQDQPIKAITSNPLEATSTLVANTITASIIVQPTVYKQLQTEEEEQDKNVSIGTMQVSKTKLVNALKKAKKLFSIPQKDDYVSTNKSAYTNTLR